MTVRSDSTRLIIRPRDPRTLRAVASRQGQVLMDAEFNEAARLALARIETETIDILGRPDRFLVPAGTGGFAITVPADSTKLTIGAGHGYLDGRLLENGALCQLDTQPHPRLGDAVPAQAIIAIKSLVRFVDAVEESAWADPALGDAQTSGRTINDWQAFPFVPGNAGNFACDSVTGLADWAALAAPSTGTLSFQPNTPSASTDPCKLTPGGGFTGLENQLFRVEVHGGIPLGTFPQIDGPRFGLDGLKLKFSRRNASVLARVSQVSGAQVRTAAPPLDPRIWFTPGSWAEIVSLHDDVDPRPALANERLFRVAQGQDDLITLEATAAQIAATGATGDGDWFLRLWDAFPDNAGSGLAVVAVAGGLSQVIDFGDGLGVQLGGVNPTFRRGDYWTCAAYADGTIDWPQIGGVYTPSPPHGPRTLYAPLAVLGGANGATEDCRVPFGTLTDKVLLYRGGDGQSLFVPGGTAGFQLLPQKLRVAVMRGETPVPFAKTEWSLPQATDPAAQINGTTVSGGGTVVTTTDGAGLAEVAWAIDAGKPLDLHRVQAKLVDIVGVGSPPVVFEATFETARHTAYVPGNCAAITAGNVQDAIDQLCKANHGRDFKNLHLTRITLRGTQATELIKDALILNGLEVPTQSFIRGIEFVFDAGPLAIDVAPWDPVVEVEIDLPYPTTDYDKAYWMMAITNPTNGDNLKAPFGFHRIRLDGQVKVNAGDQQGSRMLWMPSPNANLFLSTLERHLGGQIIIPALPTSDQLKNRWTTETTFQRLMCRLRLRSALIFAQDGDRDRIYLNAEHLGVKGNVTSRELMLRALDPQAAGDLDMFFYLRFG